MVTGQGRIEETADARGCTQMSWDGFPHRRPSASICGEDLLPPAGRPANAGERETLRRANRRSGRIQSGCAWARRSLANPPAGRGPKPQGQSGAKPVRFAQRTLASGAGRWQHRSAGDFEPSPGIRSKKAEREQLNDERGVKPLPVSHGPRRSRIGNRLPLGWVRGRFCILAPEIGVPRRREAGNYGGAGASHMPGSPGRVGVLPT